MNTTIKVEEVNDKVQLVNSEYFEQVIDEKITLLEKALDLACDYLWGTVDCDHCKLRTQCTVDSYENCKKMWLDYFMKEAQNEK